MIESSCAVAVYLYEIYDKRTVRPAGRDQNSIKTYLCI